MPFGTIRISRCPGRPAHDAAFDKALEFRHPLADLGSTLQQLLEAPTLFRSACSNRALLRCSGSSNRSALPVPAFLLRPNSMQGTAGRRDRWPDPHGRSGDWNTSRTFQARNRAFGW